MNITYTINAVLLGLSPYWTICLIRKRPDTGYKLI